jgi:hypothetical protein
MRREDLIALVAEAFERAAKRPRAQGDDGGGRRTSGLGILFACCGSGRVRLLWTHQLENENYQQDNQSHDENHLYALPCRHPIDLAGDLGDLLVR